MTPRIANWRKSTHSGAQANCVEVGTAAEVVGVRDSKDPAGAVLTVAPSAWVSFTAGIRAGTFRA